MPILPPAPPRFSMTTGLPSASPSGVLISRAAMSVPPPAGKHTIMVICRSGYSARAAEHGALAAAIKNIAGTMGPRIRPARGRVDMGALLLGVFYCPMIMAAISAAVMRRCEGAAGVNQPDRARSHDQQAFPTPFDGPQVFLVLAQKPLCHRKILTVGRKALAVRWK